MPTAKEIVLSKINRNLHWPIILFFAFTIGNYSFFRYSILGEGSVPFALKAISQLRIVFSVWIIFFAFRFDFSTTLFIIKKNIDVLALAICWWLSALVNQHPTSYLLYAPWTFISFIATILVICYTAFISGSLSTFLTIIIKTIWKGNLIIFFLLLVSLLLIRPGSGPYNLLFTSNTFWAYPTLILGITSLIQARFMTDVRWKRVVLYFIYVVCLIGIYYSARRTPLFLLLLTFAVLFIPFKMSHLLFLGGLFLVFFILVQSINIKTITSELPDSYMKYRIERMFGLVKGRKETSYLDRQKIWDMYLNSFYEQPLLGTGLASNQNKMEGVPKKFEGYSAHNTFVGLIAETGLVGTVCFLIVMIRSLLMLSSSTSLLWLKIYLILFMPTVMINWVEYNLIPGQIFFLYSIMVWLLPRGLAFLKKTEPV